MCVTTSSTVWLSSRGTSKLANEPCSPPRQTLTCRLLIASTAIARSGSTKGGRRPSGRHPLASCAFVQPGEHELPVAEGLGRGETAVARAQHDLEQLVAALVEVL